MVEAPEGALEDARAMQPYLTALRELLHSSPGKETTASVAAALDGEASTRLRVLVRAESRRELSAFPTNSGLRRKAVAKATVPKTGVIVDPACGLGDLLIEVASGLPLAKTPEDTLYAWEERLAGTDICEVFIEATKLRLLLLITSRHEQPFATAPEASNRFPLIRVADGLRTDDCESARLTIMNPPFHRVKAAMDCEWSSGSTSAAAIFLERAAEQLKVGSELVAILPDVLRSGTRYQAWRNRIEELVDVVSIEACDVFDRWADVHVCILHLRKSTERQYETRWFKATEKERLNAIAEISVGPVVPHRHEETGVERPFLTARLLSGHDIFEASKAPKRSYDTRVEHPPFLAIRRTSRPEDRKRIVHTKVLGDEPVLVENHLIIVRPRECTSTTFAELAEIFDRPESTAWLNDRLRCRHLTVTALAELPTGGGT